MKLIVSLCIFCFCFVQSLTSQNHQGTLGQVEFGASFLDLQVLNEALEIQNFVPLSNNYFALGAGLRRYQGRLLYGGSLYGYMVKQSVTGVNNATLFFNYGLLDLGLQVNPLHQATKIFPSLGVGVGMGQLRILRANELQPVRFNAGGFLLDAGLNVVYITEALPETDFGLNMGIKVGYMRKFGNGWTLSDLEPEQQTALSPQGPYFRLTFGMGKGR